ncbi:membrane protein insertase YidC [Corynebacterium sp. sy017]|uniref:membrane protein insertase YidC n=1 Tax=unclassified Corynebacterium TaxID=2624378 RepID=UPI001184B6D8|nr:MULTISPECIES: membrane protein insertase YidC [unclassified Corynebacterium]MBP3089470.1 membrane protein insertase YidC [Corynebacterium sp. sy017]TSD90849.1 membrane protein insertase YidC [Corynebacterium sp. SY003]
MLEVFAYPVSGVMKLWHLLLFHVFHLDENHAWLLSIFGLVITVRGLIAPLSWLQLRAGRISVLMRPELRRLQAEYARNPTEKNLRLLKHKQHTIKAENNYNPAAGCLPIFIQIPVFLGLYRVVKRVSTVSDNTHATQNVGMLSSNDVNAFLATKLSGMPLSAFPRMGTERLAELGTSVAEVRHFLLPLIILACIFTTINILLALVRNSYALDHGSPVAIYLNRIVICILIAAPLLLLSAGLGGAVPIAVALYWVSNNLWTTAQNITLYSIIRIKYPYGSEHFQAQAAAKEQRAAYLRQKKEINSYRRILGLAGIVDPQARAEYRQFYKKLREHKKQLKTAHKEYQRQHSAAYKQYKAKPPKDYTGRHRRPEELD